jgi:hypothetical protein
MDYTKIKTFSSDYCDSIIKKLPECTPFYLSLTKNRKDIDTTKYYLVKNQPSNADAWYVEGMDEMSEIKSLWNNVVFKNENITNTDYKLEFHVLKYETGQFSYEHKDIYDFTMILLLNDDFEGGDLYVSNLNTNLKKGDLVYFAGSKRHKVDIIRSGKRYVLVSFITIPKNKKTMI